MIFTIGSHLGFIIEEKVKILKGNMIIHVQFGFNKVSNENNSYMSVLKYC
jgi:hypothetical protein